MSGTPTNDRRNEVPNDASANLKIRNQAQLDSTCEVTAPENVAFQYDAAGPFSRAVAYANDVVVMFAYWFFSTIGVIRFLDYLGESDFTQILAEVFILLNTMFVVWFWNACFEAFWQGRTIGKACVGLRVISRSGRPLRLSQALVRNVLRTADFMLGPFLVPIMGSNERMARLGDVAADTVVVVSRRKTKKFKRGKKDGSIATEPFDEKLLANVASRIPEDFIVDDSLRKALFLYASRRADLAPQRRLEVAKTLADALQDRMRIAPRLNPDAFLYALYKISLGMDRQTR